MRNNRGITLVSLVVTIIVILILSSVSISAVFSDNGIIKTSRETRKRHEASLNADEREVNMLFGEYENMMKGTTIEKPKDDAEEQKPDPEPDTNTGWDESKVTKVTSADNRIVPVPKGYTASTIDGEKSVSTGFVIKEGSDGSAKAGVNEFVWVPVDDINDLYDTATSSGQLWNFGTFDESANTFTARNPAIKVAHPTEKNSSIREPDVVTNAGAGKDSIGGSKLDAVTDNLAKINSSLKTAGAFKTQLQNEFETMKNSVERYGGFYIGRYETGALQRTQAVVQKYNKELSGQDWYTQYKLNKGIATNYNVTSHMIWGTQWDATLRWFQTSSTEYIKDFPTKSDEYGNFKGREITYSESLKEMQAGTTKKTKSGTATIIPSGGSEKTKINNIYDMSGNVWDLTMEAYGVDARVARGASCNEAIKYSRAEVRVNNYTPDTSSQYFGSRAALYINI